MKIKEDTYVAINYTLTLDSDEVVDASVPGKPFSFVVGFGQVIPGLENGLKGMEQGQDARITVEAEEGYGPVREELCREIPRENFPGDTDIEPGMQFQVTGPQGAAMFRVKSVSDKVVVADFNHPLAGERLHFQVKVAEVREARPEDLHQCGVEHVGCCKEHNHTH